MSRELTIPLLTAVEGPVTAPRYFLELVFASQTLRLTTGADVFWKGNLFIGYPFTVGEASYQGTTQRVSVEFQDAALTVTTFLLADGIADRPVSLWKYYGDTEPGAFDVVPILLGLGDEMEIDPEGGKCSISAVNAGRRTQFSPRTFITRENGFSIVPPRGTLITFRDTQFRLEPDNA